MAQNPIVGFHLVVDGDMSGTITSPVQLCEYQDNIGLQFIWTGTPTGTFAIQVSNNYNSGLGTGTFTPLILAASPAPAGSASSYALVISNIPFSYYRVVYTAGSSSGTLNIWVSGKGI